jgi:hypothetical protein
MYMQNLTNIAVHLSVILMYDTVQHMLHCLPLSAGMLQLACNTGPVSSHLCLILTYNKLSSWPCLITSTTITSPPFPFNGTNPAAAQVLHNNCTAPDRTVLPAGI